MISIVTSNRDIMPLLIRPLFGDGVVVPFTLPLTSWTPVYQYLHCHYFPTVRLEQLRLYHNESPDLSHIQDKDELFLLVSDPMVERWVSEHQVNGENTHFYHSTLSWYDIRWGDPYENPSVLYRTPLTIHVLLREKEGVNEFMLNPNYFRAHYAQCEQVNENKWYPTLREGCSAFRKEWNNTEGEEAMTEKTVEHIIHLWELYHGTNKHLVDQGRYYDY